MLRPSSGTERSPFTIVTNQKRCASTTRPYRLSDLWPYIELGPNENAHHNDSDSPTYPTGRCGFADYAQLAPNEEGGRRGTSPGSNDSLRSKYLASPWLTDYAALRGDMKGEAQRAK